MPSDDPRSLLFTPARPRMGRGEGETMRLLKLKEVVAATGLSRSSIYALIAEGLFPRPLRVASGPAGSALDRAGGPGVAFQPPAQRYR